MPCFWDGKAERVPGKDWVQSMSGTAIHLVWLCASPSYIPPTPLLVLTCRALPPLRPACVWSGLLPTIGALGMRVSTGPHAEGWHPLMLWWLDEDPTSRPGSEEPCRATELMRQTFIEHPLYAGHCRRYQALLRWTRFDSCFKGVGCIQVVGERDTSTLTSILDRMEPVL